jgi:molybdopterin-binding protein
VEVFLETLDRAATTGEGGSDLGPTVRFPPLTSIAPGTSRGRTMMQTSARNQLSGTITSVQLGAVMAEVIVDVSGVPVVAAITKESAERLGLAEGKSVSAIIKATDVMIGIE